MLNCSFRIPHRLFRACISVVFGAKITVHANAADEGALAFSETNICEEVCGGDVGGGEVGGCGCAVGEGAVDAAGVGTAGGGERGEGGFEGEGVGV